MRLAYLSAGITLSLLLLLGTRSQGTIIIDNGLAPPNPDNVINTFIPESVFVQNSGSGDPTTVELVDGGQVGDQGSERFEVFNSSQIVMSGGLVYDDIFAHASSSVLVTGGTIQSGLLAYDSSAVTVDGGNVNGVFVDPLSGGLWGSATALISGGSVGAVWAQGLGAVATVTGGSDLVLFRTQGEGTVNIVGGSFAVNGEPVGFGEIPAIYGANGTLTGVLKSGESFSASFARDIDTGDHLNPIIQGKIVLVPEPSTALLLAAGLVGLAAAGRRRA